LSMVRRLLSSSKSVPCAVVLIFGAVVPPRQLGSYTMAARCRGVLAHLVNSNPRVLCPGSAQVGRHDQNAASSTHRCDHGIAQGLNGHGLRYCCQILVQDVAMYVAHSRVSPCPVPRCVCSPGAMEVHGRPCPRDGSQASSSRPSASFGKMSAADSRPSHWNLFLLLAWFFQPLLTSQKAVLRGCRWC
jgi:hypothetical protein